LKCRNKKRGVALFNKEIGALIGSRVLAVMLAIITTFMIMACQPTVYLMPTPLAIEAGIADPFQRNPNEQKQSNKLSVFYATNRDPKGPNNARAYKKSFSQDIHLGNTVSRIGDEDVDWETLYADSQKKKRSQKYQIHLDQVYETGEIKANESLDELPTGAKQFVTAINDALKKTRDKDITVYVHGANNNFYRSSSQAAQFRHFTGRNSVVVLFAWPSAENLLLYSVDKKNAAQTAGVFARFIEVLGRYTEAEYVNIIAYSAGASVASPGLVQLRKSHADFSAEAMRSQFRIGHVYLAAPDIKAKNFLKQLPLYLDITRNVTMTANMQDTVLSMADVHMDESRLGKPTSEEFTTEQLQWIKEASYTDDFDIISITHSYVPGSAGAHDSWYNDPWVSSDVIAQLISNYPPVQRGLDKGESLQGLELWYYPKDYPERLAKIIKEFQAKHNLK